MPCGTFIKTKSLSQGDPIDMVSTKQRIKMEITINGKNYTCPDGCILSEALRHCQIDLNTRAAVAVNKRVVMRSKIDTHQLAHGDEVLIVNPCYGG